MKNCNGFNDKLGIHDDVLIQDDKGGMFIPMGKKKTKIIGEVSVTDGLTGKTMFTFNDVIIPGATFVLEQMFKKRSTYGMTTLSTDLAINAAATPTDANVKDELIFGFMLGIGGVTPPDNINAVYFKDKSVSQVIPMRVVPMANDLPAGERAKYALKKQVGTDYYYYAKKFDSDITIKHLYTDGTEVPPNVNELATTLGILVYGEAAFTVSTADLREYFMNTYGSIDTCRFNSLALIAGFPGASEYGGVRAITKVNMPNMYLLSTESFYIFSYKVYVI